MIKELARNIVVDEEFREKLVVHVKKYLELKEKARKLALYAFDSKMAKYLEGLYLKRLVEEKKTLLYIDGWMRAKCSSSGILFYPDSGFNRWRPNSWSKTTSFDSSWYPSKSIRFEYNGFEFLEIFYKYAEIVDKNLAEYAKNVKDFIQKYKVFPDDFVCKNKKKNFLNIIRKVKGYSVDIGMKISYEEIKQKFELFCYVYENRTKHIVSKGLVRFDVLPFEEQIEGLVSEFRILGDRFDGVESIKSEIVSMATELKEEYIQHIEKSNENIDMIMKEIDKIFEKKRRILTTERKETLDMKELNKFARLI